MPQPPPDAPADAALLEAYAQSPTNDLLGQLAHRHAPLVYSAARRQVRDEHLAQDVTQAVFLLLFSKASSIRNPAALAGWLYKTTYFTARNAMRIENRRQRHEQQAAAEKARQTADQSDDLANDLNWEEISPILDRAMARLPEHDRQSILLRYFQGLSLPEVAAAMSVSEEAAKKRLSRGLQRLRNLLGSRAATLSAVALGATLSARAAEAMPPTLHASIGAIAAGQSSAASKTAWLLAEKITRFTLLRTIAAIAIGSSLFAGICGWIYKTIPSSPTPAIQSVIPVPPPPAPVVAKTKTLPDSTAPFLTLSGCITASPVPVDLMGDGKTEIVLTYMGMVNLLTRQPIPLATGVTPDTAAYVAAFNLDGTPLRGFPVKVMSAQDHELAAPSDSPDFYQYPNYWLSYPAIQPGTPGSPGFLVVSRPSGPAKRDRGALVIQADGSSQKLLPSFANPDPGTTFQLVPLPPKGTLAILGGGTFCTLSGSHVPAWRGGKVPSGFCASAADTAHDGRIRSYIASQRRGPANAVVDAFDANGKSFGAWPQKIGLKSHFPPSLGSVFDPHTMQVILPDVRNQILAWTWDGKPFGNCAPESSAQSADGSPLSPEQAQSEKIQSIFKDNIECDGPVSLADLDGDGLAEIIAIDDKTHTLRAWHGDGSGFANPDGIIAQLGPADVFGVSVAGPDASGSFDFFAGPWWIHRTKDGATQTQLMIPAAPDTQCQDTIADLYHDGQAEILIGTEDGRVFIYHTNLKFTPKWAQWPMFAHDIHHTSTWTPP